MKKIIFVCCALVFTLSSCHVENLESDINNKLEFDEEVNPKPYVLATEQFNSVDITRFFSFDIKEIDANKTYDLIGDELFINSDPSTSSGAISIGKYVFSLAKDKKGYSSTPGIFRLTQNKYHKMFISKELHLTKNNLFPGKKICIVDKTTGFFYNEGEMPYGIYCFDPYKMEVKWKINLKDEIEKFRPNVKWVDDDGNNLVRTGSMVIDHKDGKLYVSIAFLSKVAFNIIPSEETNFYLAVIDLATNKFEKFIQYPNTRTVGFFVSENLPTSKTENGALYFCSWGWNQWGVPMKSKIFRIKAGETDFDKNWEFNIDDIFGKGHIAQSMICYNNKIYAHISNQKYTFASSQDKDLPVRMNYYEIDPSNLSFRKLDIEASEPSPRMNVFNIVDDKLFICVANTGLGKSDKFNGVYSLDKSGVLKPEIRIEGKYRPTKIYKLENN